MGPWPYDHKTAQPMASLGPWVPPEPKRLHLGEASQLASMQCLREHLARIPSPRSCYQPSTEETGRAAEGVVRNDPGQECSGWALTFHLREMLANFKSPIQSFPQVAVYLGTATETALRAAPVGRSLGGQKPRCSA